EETGYPETRKYRLEGYLYPDTYYFYKDSKEYLVINKLLNNFYSRVWIYYESTFKADIEAIGMTFDEIVTLAAMIQGEAKLYIDFECISYVFHNRLKSSDPQFKWLQSDATVQYFLPEHVEELTQAQLDTDNPYNTYVYEGLPPGAICNPGFDAISAAIYPDAPIDGEGKPINAYFFVSNKAGKTYYAITLTGHNANKVQVAKDNAALADDNT
ncbi:MAG: endolytic transglycosylase MltG, partial [Eubacteriales bacterium]|nr:endolytic transglycosylase MltG [Eubacteriales bacterium]